MTWLFYAFTLGRSVVGQQPFAAIDTEMGVTGL